MYRMKNARAKRAKVVFIIFDYADLWRSCHRYRRGSFREFKPTSFQGSLFQQLREAENRDPGNEVEFKQGLHHFFNILGN